MALTLVCDCPCKGVLPAGTKPVGRISQKFYCAEARAVYDAADAEIEAALTALRSGFAKTREEILSTAREKLGELPDEWRPPADA